MNKNIVWEFDYEENDNYEEDNNYKVGNFFMLNQDSYEHFVEKAKRLSGMGINRYLIYRIDNKYIYFRQSSTTLSQTFMISKNLFDKQLGNFIHIIK